MATTTQVTSYRSAGQPDDGTGAVGDICWDTSNRITWVKQSNNSWANGAYSNIGPTGPAQLSGTGAPASGLGQIGNGYTDQASGLTYLKSSSGWAQVGNILGPQGSVGPTGYTSLTTQAAVVNAQTYFAATVSSTPTTLPIANTTAPLIYFPLQASALMGLNVVNNGVAVTANLVDVTASTTVASIAIAAGNFTSSYTASQYPLIASHNYQWTITGSGSANLLFSPIYLSAAAGTTNIIGTWSGFSTAQGTAFSGTANYPGPFGRNGTSGTCRSIPTNSPKALHSAVGYYSPSTAGAAAASVTCNVLLYNSSGGTTSTLTSFTLPNTGAPTVYQPTSPLSITSGLTIYASITGSGTGFVTFDMNLIG